MAVTKPDATAFDNANDSIANSRAELYTMATSFNTIADEYNAGTLGGSGLAGNYPTRTDLGTVTGTATYTITTPFSVLYSNQTGTAVQVNIEIDNQPDDSCWIVFVAKASGETGHSRVTFFLDGGFDSAGGYDFSQEITGVGYLFHIHRIAGPSGSSDVYITRQIESVTARYTLT